MSEMLLGDNTVAETQLFEAYVLQQLKRWGETFPLVRREGRIESGSGYPSRSTVYVAMIFGGRSPRSNVPPPPPDVDAMAWLVEQIVCQIQSYDTRMALILRAAFCARGSWEERMETANSVLPRSERFLCGSRGIYYRTRDMGVDEVGWYLRVMGDPE